MHLAGLETFCMTISQTRQLKKYKFQLMLLSMF